MKINSVEIREFEPGLFCVNDLFMAAGSPKNKNPGQFKKTETCKSLISITGRKSTSEQNQWVSKNIKGEMVTLANEVMCIAYAMYLNTYFYQYVIESFIEHHNWQEELDNLIKYKADVLDKMVNKGSSHSISEAAQEIWLVTGLRFSVQQLNSLLERGAPNFPHWYILNPKTGNKTWKWQEWAKVKGYVDYSIYADANGNRRPQPKITSRGIQYLICWLGKHFVGPIKPANR